VWRTRPRLHEGETTVALRSLAQATEPGWGEQAMRFDRLPPDYRGDAIKIALIDTGVATSHPQLDHLDQGFAARDSAPWSQDEAGHGTPCAGIITAASDPDNRIRGYAPHAELHVVSLAPDARASDLVAALDYCLGAGIDVACVGFGCPHGSAIVEQRLIAAKQRGMAVVAAAGSTGGPVQFPACSRHVLAVGAVGRAGTFPEESPHALNARADGGLFVPAFSCCGPEIDVVAPGVAVISCQSPQGSVAADGTSLAAAHVAALAALVLAHHADFQREFAARNALRVERLFQIVKLTARPLGDPLRTGAGLPDAPRALGLPAQLDAPPLDAGLEEMRAALRHTGIFGGGARAPLAPEPPRGPAMIAHLPLRAASSAIGAPDVVAAMRELGAAMAMAGLSQWSGNQGSGISDGHQGADHDPNA
jgi:subtilisin